MSSRLRGLFVAMLTIVVVAMSLAVPTLAASGEDPPPAPGAESVEPPTQTIKMLARNWFWDPEVIRVKKGTRLILQIQGFDAPHSFQLKEYGLNVPVPEGKTATVDFIVDKAGDFKWRCGRPCGNGCPKMRGVLHVLD